MPITEPYPELDELLASMGEAGARICEIDASEAVAGNISIYTAWQIEVRRRFSINEVITLPMRAPTSTSSSAPAARR